MDSNTVTIDNTAPSIDSVAIDPDPAAATDTLTCSYTGFDDADDDADDHAHVGAALVFRGRRVRRRRRRG